MDVSRSSWVLGWLAGRGVWIHSKGRYLVTVSTKYRMELVYRAKGRACWCPAISYLVVSDKSPYSGIYDWRRANGDCTYQHSNVQLGEMVSISFFVSQRERQTSNCKEDQDQHTNCHQCSFMPCQPTGSGLNGSASTTAWTDWVFDSMTSRGWVPDSMCLWAQYKRHEVRITGQVKMRLSQCKCL